MVFYYICTENDEKMKKIIEKDSSSRYLFHQISDIIEERGVMMVDYTSSLIINNEEYISPYSVIALCHRGSVETEYDLRPVQFRAHDISVMRPGHVMKNMTASDDYSAQLIVASADWLNNMRQQYLNHHLATQKAFDKHPNQHLSDEEYRQVCEVFNLLRTVCDMDGNYRKELIFSVFHTLMVLLTAFREEQGNKFQDVSRQLSPLFNAAVIEHFRESREVTFYARMFNLSPKYFSTLIKQETGISASEWIDRYVVLQAKYLLDHRRSLNIQQIANHLGFSEQASFSRFFKKETGQSPKEYREQNHR
jgi:AraC-like DNA-binding protein